MAKVTSTAIKALALHGFLGSGQDWNPLRHQLLQKGIDSSFWLTPHLFQPGPLSLQHDPSTWLENLRCAVSHHFFHEPVVLIGYSLGGRLALHAALKFPELFSQVWLLSTNPGLLFSQTVEDRLQWEKQWAQNFQDRPWAQVIELWNDQPVFHHTSPRSALSYRESEFDRQILASSLTRWSLTQHQFCFSRLFDRNDPHLYHWHWCFGEHDRKFLSVQTELSRHNVLGHVQVLAGAGHRLLLDAPETLAQLLWDFREEKKL